MSAAACAAPAPLGVVANSPGTVEAGVPERVVLALVDPDSGERIGSPDLEVEVSFHRDGETVGPVRGEWVWAVPQVSGFYVAEVVFPEPGTWELQIEVEGRGRTDPAPVAVVEEGLVPGVGDPAPRSLTRTYPDVPFEELTTDPDPDPRFYQSTVAEAVTDGTPAVIVFATPAFCQTATCGPVLEVVKQVAADRPDLDVVHVEIYENLQAGPEGLRVVPAVEEWGLPSEPWVFVVDSQGSIHRRFEGVVSTDELERALDGVSG